MHAFPSATRTHYFCRILARCPCNTDNTKCSYVDPRDQGAKTCTAKQACLPQSRRPVQQTLILAHNTNDSCVLDRRDFELFMKTASHCGRFGHPAHTSSSRTQYEHTQLDILFYTDKPSIHSTSMLVPANLKQGLHFSVWRSNVFLQLTTCALVLKLFRIEQFVPRRVCCYRTVMHCRKLKLNCKQKSNKPPGGDKKGWKGRGGNLGLQLYMWHHFFNSAIWKTKTAFLFFAHICKGNTNPQAEQHTDTVRPNFFISDKFHKFFQHWHVHVSDSLCENSRTSADITKECGQSKTKVCTVHTRRNLATGRLTKVVHTCLG